MSGQRVRTAVLVNLAMVVEQANEQVIAVAAYGCVLPAALGCRVQRQELVVCSHKAP